MKNLIQIAIGELGVVETSGSNDNARILQYAKESDFDWINDDETPWCSVFMNWVAKQADYERSKSAAARSWLAVGNKVTNPEPGDIVIYWRNDIKSRSGHVGIFLGFASGKTRIYTLGGNQMNSVSISAYPMSRLLGFRRLRKRGLVAIPTVVLARPAQGPNVVILQDSLKAANFDCGTSDGFFGPMTEKAIIQLQSRNPALPVHGVFDSVTRLYLLELLTASDIEPSAD